MYSASYQTGPDEREFEKQDTDQMLRTELIESALTEWTSPILVVPNEYQTLRFCVDHQKRTI